MTLYDRLLLMITVEQWHLKDMKETTFKSHGTCPARNPKVSISWFVTNFGTTSPFYLNFLDHLPIHHQLTHHPLPNFDYHLSSFWTISPSITKFLDYLPIPHQIFKHLPIHQQLWTISPPITNFGPSPAPTFDLPPHASPTYGSSPTQWTISPTITNFRIVSPSITNLWTRTISPSITNFGPLSIRPYHPPSQTNFGPSYSKPTLDIIFQTNFGTLCLSITSRVGLLTVYEDSDGEYFCKW